MQGVNAGGNNEYRVASGGNYYNRGGFSGRGRGNMYGRGNNFQRFNSSENQYVPAQKMSEANVNDGKIQGAKDKGNGKINDTTSNSQAMNAKEKVRVNEVLGVNGEGAKKNGQSNSNQNRFAALAKDLGIDGNGVLDVNKVRIDELCVNGELVREEERKKRPTEIKDYYQKQIQDSIKGMKEDGIKVMIQNLDK
ncbi:hypothetical protein CTI12_AA021970 [Artemisia annua]|uniref:Uncharacterized protein n=1 Tax=Artemisia annua TaxID=35608 RepID=A0A2U1QIU5_ARTAN|nr:hypothetical protein CTI12_AA021970 [Artemisia annua]